MTFDGYEEKPFFRFEDLRVYHKAIDYAHWLYENTREMTNHDICIRFNATSRKIAFHIAEGSSRKKSQFSYYLKMAKSAIRECVVFTAIVEKSNLFNEEQVAESRKQLIELTKMVGALIGSLQKNGKRKNTGDNGSSEKELVFEEITAGDFDDFDD